MATTAARASRSADSLSRAAEMLTTFDDSSARTRGQALAPPAPRRDHLDLGERPAHAVGVDEGQAHAGPRARSGSSS